MKCVTPMFRRYWIGERSKGKIVSRKEVLESLSFNPNYISFCLDKMNSQARQTGKGYIYETIPCRHCWACNLNYSAEWATRIMYECMKWEHNYFVTLTFNDNWLPIAEYMTIGDERIDNIGDEIWQEGTLHDKYVDDFIHNLREYLRTTKKHTGMKYFIAGEYGEKTHRPHYHMILMNCPLDIKEFYDFHQDERYKLHWKTKELERFWGYKKHKNDSMEKFQPYGMIDIGEVEWSSAAYVARYCTKKLYQKKSDREYALEGKEPEYVRMSRNIGIDYYKEHKHEIYKTDSIVMRTVQGNVGSYKPPKAWDRKFKEEFPEQFEEIRQSRQKAAERTRVLETQLSDYTDLKKLEIKEELLNKKVKMLPRVGEW